MIWLHKEAQDFLNEQKTFVLHKPKGYVSSQPEKGMRAAVKLLTPRNQDLKFPSKVCFERKHLKHLAPVGRLDYDSTGLLILTQKGVLAKNIISPTTSVEKEYVVKVSGKLTKDKIKKLQHGMVLDGKKLKKAQVFKSQAPQTLVFILKEGRKRQIRRMCDDVDLEVLELKRVRVGGLTLGGLTLGCWRYLTSEEELSLTQRALSSS